MATPDSVGPYRIVRKLGSGGMGDVYLADDTRLGRQVALKSLSQKWAQAPDARRRLTHEARAAAGLNHTNIAAVYDVVETAGTSWIVMEYAPGESLAEAPAPRAPAPGGRGLGGRPDVRCPGRRPRAAASSIATSSPRTS